MEQTTRLTSNGIERPEAATCDLTGLWVLTFDLPESHEDRVQEAQGQVVGHLAPDLILVRILADDETETVRVIYDLRRDRELLWFFTDREAWRERLSFFERWEMARAERERQEEDR